MNGLINGDSEPSEMNRIVQDAKDLYERLIGDEETVNELLCKANFLNNAAVTMVEYQEAIEKFDGNSDDSNNLPSQVSSVVTESQQLNRLRNENAQLKASLEDHQFALELIMSKYRQQVCQFLNHQRNQKVPTTTKTTPTVNPDQVMKLSNQIKEMAELMMNYIENDENNQMARDKVISQLQIENENLRELVKIALKFESLKEEDIPSDILVNIR